MKHRKLIFPGLFVFSLLACHMTWAGPRAGLANGKEPIELKFNLKPGEKYLFSSETSQRIVQEMMGQKMTTIQSVTSHYIYDILSAQDGVTKVQVTFDKIKMDTDVAGMQRLTYDSDNPDESAKEMKPMSVMIGKSFSMYVSEAGNVERIEGLSEIFDELEGMQGEMLKQFFGDSTMMQNMSMMTNIYPDGPVDVGSQWNKAFSGPLAGMMKVSSDMTFSLSAIEGSNAQIAVQGTLDFSKLENGNPMLQHATLNLNGTQTGTLTVDTRSGLPMKSVLNQEIKGDLEIQGMKIPMTMVSDITITGVKL